MNKLKKVQLYLDPDNLALVDELARELKVTRSKIMRDALDAVATRYVKAKELIKPKKSQKNALLEMAGIEESKTGTVGLNVDEIYLND
ncbi:hypothetical protein A3D78_03030 [Candidatus Gottesmanbacteria bacterium RIFCSPHIGHO2_02_FULL_39_14]|uniref:Ribbon-helix-helix protein CopG domain-containing protein n=1 Tax=Candidatus Gottesmanbacteria bacterium RIFCSPHIGHO2_02_FULL_39_14 TaxID=1798383 RepID=A0A1F5ZUW1_9BACT|nr:MAG: hypothetical protein A3D78_03030 [Candidatus Gottesmanbacteria bacterium RIFCSPHIGHO2_02_FULL_39_14]